MKRILFFLMLLLVTASFAQAKTYKSIRIASEGAWPPFNEIDKDGKLVGFEIDYARLLCEKMKIKCTISAQGWDGLIPALLAKKYDAIIASMSITAEREKIISFSQPYYRTTARFIAKIGKFSNLSESDLKNARIGVQKATIHENFVKAKYNSAKIKSYGEIGEAYLDLAAGRIDLVFADTFNMDSGFLKKDDNAKKYEFVGKEYSDPKFFGTGIGIGLRKADKELKEMFNKAIEETYKDGSFKKLNDRYFDYNIGVQ